MDYERGINPRIYEVMQEVSDAAAEKLAGGFYKRLQSYIQDLQSKTSNDEQLIVYFLQQFRRKILGNKHWFH